MGGGLDGQREPRRGTREPGPGCAWSGREDRLRSITSGSTTYLTASYNGDGLRISKSDLWTGSHNFSWGPGGVLFDDNGTGNVYTPGLARRQGSTDRFCQTDWLGSTRYLSDSTGNNFPNALRFDAFGNRSATGGTPYDPIDFQFAGGEGYQTEYADATINEPGVGLQYLQQRYYDPVIGRFISPDPLGFAAGTNLYLYANDDPVNGVDPAGTDAQGQQLIMWWLYGLGKAFVPSASEQGAWGHYMMANPTLQTFVAGELRQVAADLAAWPTGYSEPFFIETVGTKDNPLAMNTNGEGCGLEHLDGYTLLNGPNAYVGGLQLYGVATKKGDQDVELSGTAVWNDIMDSNYWQDTAKMWIARSLFPLAMFTARDYIARIQWHFDVEHTWGDNWARGNRSWPFAAAR